MKRIFYLITLIILFSLPRELYSQSMCYDTVLLQGDENVVRYGMDTTYNWWAITEPFSGKARLYVNNFVSNIMNDFTAPSFSRDGKEWASFAYNASTLYLVKNSEVKEIGFGEPLSIMFAPANNSLSYSYKINNETYFVYNNGKKLKTNRIVKDFFVSQFGDKIAFLNQSEVGVALHISDGFRTQEFDEILPIGFYHDNQFVYCARYGNNWRIYKNNDVISNIYSNIKDGRMNNDGTIFAAVCRTSSSKSEVLLYSDEYYEPLLGKPYDAIYKIDLHPTAPIVTYAANDNNNDFVIINSTEYGVKRNSTSPKFTNDGSEIYYTACDIDCSIYINGARTNIKGVFYSDVNIARAPKTKTLCYSSATSLISLEYESGYMNLSIMLDEVILPRYNRFSNRYETLGKLNQRLYLLSCPINRE